jgi:hypothetical protein
MPQKKAGRPHKLGVAVEESQGMLLEVANTNLKSGNRNQVGAIRRKEIFGSGKEYLLKSRGERGHGVLGKKKAAHFV